MTEFNTPSHYVLSDGSDSMDALEKILGPEEFKGFLRGNAIKYLIRYDLKGGVEDLYKAEDYIARLAAVVADEEEEPEEEAYESDLAGLIKAAMIIKAAFGEGAN